MAELMERSLKTIVESQTLQWVFVGGKGGVGKTTTSCSLATLLAKSPFTDPDANEARQRRVLIISTDPAHNLSDAFAQKLGNEPTEISGVTGLFGMEIDPSSLTNANPFKDLTGNIPEGSPMAGIGKALSETLKALPGVDEVTVFSEISRQVEAYHFDTVVFDTAPTGHTLRLLALPQTLNDTVERLLGVDGIGPLMAAASQFMSSSAGVDPEQLKKKVTSWRSQVQAVQARFADAEKTTFVCVCIPEFLSVYETERLVQELMKYNINCEHVVVNQLVMRPTDEAPCRMCSARQGIQGRYLEQIDEMYDAEDFSVVRMPLHGAEVRGVERLARFGEFLLTPYEVDTHGYL